MTMRTSSNQLLRGLLLFLAIVLAASAASAQVLGLATLRGTVFDQTGAVVPSVTIKVMDQATGVLVRALTSSSDGAYEIPDLKPGTYKVQASLRGFATVVFSDVVLDSGHIERLDVKLTPATVNETINVVAGAPVIETQSGTITDEFTSKQVVNAPLVEYYPEPFAMFQTLPGVQTYSWNLEVNGMLFDQVGQEFDGVSSDSYGEQRNNMYFYQEASITLVDAPASSARPVSYNLTSKRGTNAFHGSAHYQRMDEAFFAQAPPQTAPPLTPLQKPHGMEHDGQAEVGGPIWKDKTFFYTSYYLTRTPASTYEAAVVPSAAMMQGNFGELCPVGFNSSGMCNSQALPNHQLYNPFNGQPFANNVIPQNMLSSVSLGLQGFYPTLAQGVGYTGSNNYLWLHPYTTGGNFSDYYSGNWLFLRLDQNLTSKNSVFFTGQLRNTPYDWPGGVPSLPQTHIRDEGMLTLQDIHTFSPRLVNHFAAGISHDLQVYGKPGNGLNLPHGETLIQKIGLQGVDPSGYNGVGMPSIGFSGQSAPTGLSELGYTQDNATDWSLSDDVTWTKGRHVLSFGETLQHFANGKDADSGGTPDYGSFSFDGRYTTGWQYNSSSSQWSALSNSGFSYADFLLGLPEYSERSSPMLNRTLSTKVFGVYAADTFKVTPKLTLDYGLRWDYEGLNNYADGLMYNFNPALNEIIVPAVHLSQVTPNYLSGLACPPGAAPTCASPTIVSGDERPTPDLGNWGPRIGVAYSLPGKAVIRGGYGLYWQRYTRSYTGTQIGYYDGPFWPLSQNYYAPTFMPPQVPGSTPPPLQFPDPYATSTLAGPSLASEGLADLGTHWHQGSIHNFNVTLEKEIKKAIGLRASYVGSRSENQIYFLNTDQKPANMTPYVNANGVPLVPFPNLSYVWQALNGGKAHYDAFEFEAKRRQGSITFDASYTLASDISNIGNVDGANVAQYLSRWAANGGDTRNRVVLTAMWHLPFGTGQHFLSDARGFVNQVVGGWTVQPMTYLASGWLFGPYFCGNLDYPNTNTYCGLPDVIPGTNGNLSRGKRSYSRWFNTPVVNCADPNGCGLGSPDSTPYVYSQTGAFMIPGCPVTDPLCLNSAQAAVGRYGNAGVNSMHGDPLDVTHLGVAKNFPIREQMALRYSLLISDLFNHPHYYNPDGTITDLFNNGSGGPCVGVLNNYNCDSSEGVFEGNHAGFRTMEMKVQFDF
ncbi:MAG TPA: TonB-dependent receptor [Terracidiphilus sp.]|nr:TonB-dependent receptor [Terracidiphilus sp.]